MAVHSQEKVVKNTVLYTIATIAQKAISFVYFWVLSSNLAPAALGAYLGMLSFASLASIGMDLGLTPLLTRQAAKEEEAAGVLLRATYAIKVPLVLGTILVLWVVMFVLSVLGVVSLTGTEWVLLGGASIIISVDAFTSGAYAILRARQNVVIESRAIVLFQTTVLVIGVASVLLSGNILLIMASLMTGSIVNAVYTLSRVRRLLRGAISPFFDAPRIRELLRLLPSFATAGIFMKVYQQADVVLLRLLTDTHTVGLYSIPAKITTALQTLIPGAFSAAVYPTLSNYAHTDRARLEHLFRYTFGILFLLSLPVGAFLAILTPVLLSTVWPQYRSVAPAMAGMLAVVPFLFLPFATGALLNATGKERQTSRNRVAMTIVNVACSVVCIPLFRERGTAIAFVLAHVLLATLDMRAAHRVVSLWHADVRRLVFGAFLSILPAIGALLLFLRYNHADELTRGAHSFLWYGAAPLLGVSFLYAVLLLLTKTVRKEDLVHLKRMLARQPKAV
jgi:O-antigen/teichoic acid export membrane protein